MADGIWPDSLRLGEEEQTNIEQFNEAVAWAGRKAWWAVVKATKRDGGQTAQSFGKTWQAIVQDVKSNTL